MSAKKRIKPLSAGMRRVIELMRSESGYWEAVHMGGFAGSCMLQEGKIGYGGRSQRVAVHTFFALLNRGVLVRASGGTQYEIHYTLAPRYARDVTKSATTPEVESDAE